MKRILWLVGVWASLCVCAAAAESPLNQRITVDYRNLPVADVLKDIGAKSGARISCSADLVQNADNVNYAVKDAEAGRVLTRILRPRGLNIEDKGDGAVSVFKLDKYDEFKVKREESHEFAEKPRVTREGDKVTIAFATKGWCDVTIAIENADGKIVRHLASGVLGDNAPEPFQWNSKRQVVVWDGKNDQDVYVDDKDSCAVRVSLGLKPQFERTLFWSPQKRVGSPSPVLAASPDGVYVGENYMMDHGKYGGTQVRLFDHQGDYVRTVYPFPADKLDKVVGLRQHAFQYAGRMLPLKVGYYGATLLKSGTGDWGGQDPFALAAQGGKVALVYKRLLRLGSDGSSGGLPLEGPANSVLVKGEMLNNAAADIDVTPRSAAFSPDGQSLYLTGYGWFRGFGYGYKSLHAVLKVDYARNAEAQVFAGSMTADGFGSEDGKFKVPTGVACDAKGRVYVSDYMNDRIQVFTPDGKLFKTVAVRRPAQVQVHRKSGEIYVFSWSLVTPYENKDFTAEFVRLAPVEDPKPITRCPLPLNPVSNWNNPGGFQYRVVLDSWADEPTLWLVPAASCVYNNSSRSWSGSVGVDSFLWANPWEGIRLLVEKDGKLVEKRDFGKDVDKSVVRRGVAGEGVAVWRQRLYVNPANGKLYVGEGDSLCTKGFKQLVEIEPATGKQKLVNLPVVAEDMCFDVNGLVYLRGGGPQGPPGVNEFVARYDPKTWREVPWDYGEERVEHKLVSGVILPGFMGGCAFWHQGGMDISLKGHLVVTTCNPGGSEQVAGGKGAFAELKQRVAGSGSGAVGRPYDPRIYPGRLRWGEIHVWDKHGKVVWEDAVPGMGNMNGIGIDQDDNLYLLSASKRIIDGKLYDPMLPFDSSGTVLKVKAGRCKALCPGTQGVPVPVTPEARPKRSTDTQLGWMEGAEWLYGGIGFCTPHSCICINCRIDLDYFNRTFAPEPQIFSVAVLDSNGNLITRIGRYGSVDDGKPLVPEGGPPNTRSIGGDEVALFHALYLATHTDRRLFIADQGNARILSVRLGYHAEEKVALRNIEGK